MSYNALSFKVLSAVIIAGVIIALIAPTHATNPAADHRASATALARPE